MNLITSCTSRVLSGLMRSSPRYLTSPRLFRPSPPLFSPPSYPTNPNGFKNYFYTSNPTDLQETEHLLDQTLASLVWRMDIPYLAPSSGRVRQQGFFAQLDQLIRKKDPGAKVYISGGVVRSLLGYVYAEIYKRQQLHADTVDTQEILHELAHQDTNAISRLNALGIGSDLDVLIEFSPDITESEKLKIFAEASQFIDALRMTAPDSLLRQPLVITADVREYQPQIDRSVRQGGSSADWLAFPISPQSGDRLRMPEAHPYIVKKFLEGRFTYLPKGREADLPKQVARAVRTCFEWPHAQMDEESRETWASELRDAIRLVKERGAVDDSTRLVFEKAVRNARWPALCNSFAIPRPDQPEETQLIRQLSQLASSKGRPAIPEFLPYKNIQGREAAWDPGGLREKGLLLSPEEFLRNHTDQGKLYHGTKSWSHYLAMLRGGLIVSTAQPSREQGAAARGRGFYTAKNPREAEVHTTDHEAVLDLFISSSPKLRVIDLQSLKREQLDALKQAADEREMDLHEYLSQECDVDIIVNDYSLLQNAAAVTFFTAHLKRSHFLDPLAKEYDPPTFNRYAYLSKCQSLSQDKEALIGAQSPEDVAKTQMQSIMQKLTQPDSPRLKLVIDDLLDHAFYFSSDWLELFPNWHEIKTELDRTLNSLINSPDQKERERGFNILHQIYQKSRREQLGITLPLSQNACSRVISSMLSSSHFQEVERATLLLKQFELPELHQPPIATHQDVLTRPLQREGLLSKIFQRILFSRMYRDSDE